MSFSNLISGAECALPANPLSQVLKHTESDRSLQQDRIAGPSGSRLQHLPGAGPAVSEQDAAMARQFFEGGGRGTPSLGMQLPTSLHIPTGLPSAAPELHEQWTMGQPPMQQTMNQTGWSAEFEAGSTQMRAPPSAQHMASGPTQSMGAGSASYQQPYMGMSSYRSPMSMYGMQMGAGGMPMGGMAQPMVEGKGKGRAVDFDAQMAKAFEALSTEETQSARIAEVDGQAVENAEKPETAEDLRKTWEELRSSAEPPSQESMAKWEAEFNQLMNGQRDELEFDYAKDMQNAWEGGLGDFDGSMAPKRIEFDEYGIPKLEPYEFEQNNPYLDGSNQARSALEEAKALLEHNGSLAEAALLLEAAIQKGDLGQGNYEAWILLGETRNMDEREEAGMRALAEGVRIAEETDQSGAGMLSLAISYTNESYDRGAHAMLVRWLRARFPDHPIPDSTMEALRKHTTWDTHQRILDVFLALARAQHAAGVMDPDVQIALGVLSYSNSDYDRAKDCFESALSARPRDYLLWNRLGSSLSNGNKPEEALGAYREALQMRPTYTRAIYNVGVACLNIGAHKEAAEHFLSVVAMQDSGAAEKNEQVWFSLRRALFAMDRPDLAEKAKAGANLQEFRQQGLDF
ncbi:TPR-like protein [Schizophyllum commune H4-8]|nr:TPR-like protein [Schizophyllum commune H4-8]KAI5890569.1 TPR-like protein [Schizophyllum commune H4-8]